MDGKAGYRMGRKYLTEAELEKVRANPYVAKASAANISYTPDFKRLVRRELLEGKNIMDIFRDAALMQRHWDGRGSHISNRKSWNLQILISKKKAN